MKRQTPNTIKLKSAGKLIIMLLVIALFTIVPFSLRADDPPPPPPMATVYTQLNIMNYSTAT